MRQRLGSVMMLHDCGELRTDFRPLRLTVAYPAPRPVHGYGIGKRLIAAWADGDVGDEVRELCAGDHHTFALKPTTSVTR